MCFFQSCHFSSSVKLVHWRVLSNFWGWTQLSFWHLARWRRPFQTWHWDVYWMLARQRCESWSDSLLRWRGTVISQLSETVGGCCQSNSGKQRWRQWCANEELLPNGYCCTFLSTVMHYCHLSSVRASAVPCIAHPNPHEKRHRH